MKCREERCRCGQDLTGIDVEPVMWTIVNGERVPFAECPRCLRYCFLVEPPTPRGGRRRAPEPEPSPAEPDVAPAPEE